jgi:glycosyltransferase involved in cell wall biosynthesis
MKILITTNTYRPNMDGCAEAAAVLAEGMARRGHRVTVATEFHPERKPNTPDANPRVEQFNISGTNNWRVGIQGDKTSYQNFLRGFPCDLMVFQNWDSWPTELALPLLKGSNAKKVMTTQGYAPHIWVPYPKFAWGLGYWIGGWPLVLKTPLMMRKFDHLVFVSERKGFDRFFDHWLAHATGYRNHSVIPNGAWPQEFNGELPDFRVQFGIGSGPLLLYVANYGDRKNQLMAVRAFRRAQLKDATLVLIGSAFSDYSKQVQQLDEALRRTHPAGRVLMLEKLDRARTCAAYRAADLFVLSAKAETQPVVLLEAMASHTPWLSTNVGCVTELPGGIVVQSEDEMVEKMKALMADPALRQRLAEEGWAACQKTYDWEQVVAAYERLFNKLCGTG